MTNSSVAVIGAGSLGGAISERLLAQGLEVTACDLDEGRLASLRAMGARTTTSAADCADCETALIVVLSEPQVKAVVAALASRAASARLVRVAVMSTVPPAAVAEVAGILRPLGVRVLDAPNSGGRPKVMKGDLTIMAGGRAEDLAEFAPIFDLIAGNVFHCGDLGAGQVTKIVNNIVCHVNTTLTAEVLRLGMAHGLTPEAMAQTMEVSTGRNYLSGFPAGIREALARHVPNREVFDGILTVLKKDTHIGAGLAARADDAYPMITGVTELISMLGDETYRTWRAVGGFSNGE